MTNICNELHMSNPVFIAAISDLTDARELAQQGQLSSLEYAHRREAALARALVALAASAGVRLHQPLSINSNGEFSLVSVAPEGSPWDTKAPYGEAFAELLNRYSPRTGTSQGASLLPENQWCWLNHFSVERLVLEQAQAVA